MGGLLMKIKLIFSVLLGLLLIASSVSAAFSSFDVIGKVRFEGVDAVRGTDFYIHTNVKNEPETVKVYARDDNGNNIPRSYEVSRYNQKHYIFDANGNPIPGSEESDNVETTTEIRRIKKHKLDDLSVKIYIPDLGIYIPGRAGDLYPGERGSRTSIWYVPEDVQPGEYVMRIVASNDDVKKVTHRYINII